MKMNDYINVFTDHLKDAIKIGEHAIFSKSSKLFNNIVICGLGGSGIGGTIITDLISPIAKIPVITVKDYVIPNFIDHRSLVIISSYSGNTEETIYALNSCLSNEAHVCVVTSGGELKSIAKNNNLNCIVIPGGHPPRAMFGYAFTQLFYILYHYKIINADFKKDFKNAISLLHSEKKEIEFLGRDIAGKLYGNTPIIYTAQGFEGVAIRLRQQINENSKMLCWHHIIPEMNHNELLGWRTNVANLAVLYLRNEFDYKRNQIRIDINKEIIQKYTDNVIEVWSKGSSLIEAALYHIHLGDWISWYLSVLNNVDAIEIDVINFLKTELGKV